MPSSHPSQMRSFATKARQAVFDGHARVAHVQKADFHSPLAGPDLAQDWHARLEGHFCPVQVCSEADRHT